MILAVAGLMFQSCAKDPGFGGKHKLTGTVTCPDGAASRAIVTLKFNATAPTTDYDYSTVADASGIYSFNSLQPGEYFMDAHCTNPETGIRFDTPGFLITIGTKKEDVKADITLD